MWDPIWKLSQQNRICFVMVDGNYTEVPGLGVAFNLFIAKNGTPPFVAGIGVKAEIGNGWYTYLATALEANTIGPVSIYVTGAGCIQQNLEYVVEQRNPGAVNYSYPVFDTITGLPIEGVEVWFTTDIVGVNIVWKGDTDVFGVAMDVNGQLPRLDPGTYYIWRQKSGYTFVDPDIEVVP